MRIYPLLGGSSNGACFWGVRAVSSPTYTSSMTSQLELQRVQIFGYCMILHNGKSREDNVWIYMEYATSCFGGVPKFWSWAAETCSNLDGFSSLLWRPPNVHITCFGCPMAVSPPVWVMWNPCKMEGLCKAEMQHDATEKKRRHLFLWCLFFLPCRHSPGFQFVCSMEAACSGTCKVSKASGKQHKTP